jgi:hypothetical protein
MMPALMKLRDIQNIIKLKKCCNKKKSRAEDENIARL